MKLATYFDCLDLHRDDKLVSLRFRRPFRVLSTCPAHGGLTDGLDAVFNHQCCEPAKHRIDALMAVYSHPQVYNSLVMDLHGLNGIRSAGLGTAANMRNLAIAEESHRDLAVLVIATGGVEGNAARAGDPASYYEYDGQFQQRGDIGPDAQGTINLIVAINTPLTEGAMVRAVMTATEAKTALLQELSVPSRQSAGLATGTGTDQIAVTAPVDGAKPLTNAGHHAVLGELIGRAVHGALKQTLELQNLLTPTRQCSCSHLLERFGLLGEQFIERVAAHLPAELAGLACRNRHAIERDPLVVAAVAGLIHAHDLMGWGVIPPPCWTEAAINHAAHVGAAVSGDFNRVSAYRRQLAADNSFSPDMLVPRAVALGFADKWTSFRAALEDEAAHLCAQTP